MDENTNFVQEFKDAALSLEVGQLSGIVETNYGFHILLRKDLTEAQRLSLAGDQLTLILEEQMAEAEVVRSEKLASIEAGSFYAGYNEAAEALMAAKTPADEGAGDAGDAGDTGEPDADGGEAGGSN